MTEIQEKSKQLEVLDKSTQDLIHKISLTNQRVAKVGFSCLVLLFVIGIFGIYQQNQLASANKNHIDCIVKLFTTPVKPGQARYIQGLNSCNIKVVPK